MNQDCVSQHLPLYLQDQRPATQQELEAIPWLRMLQEDRSAQGVARVRLVQQEVRVAKVGPGELVARVGRPVSHWFGVVSGLLKLSVDSEDGYSTSFVGIPAGGWFGEGTVLKRETYRYDIVTLRNSLIAGISVDLFHALLEHSLVFNRFVMWQLNERLSQFIAGRACDRMRSPEARVAHTVASLINPMLYPSADKHLKITQQELADLAGLSRQRVNVALHALAHQGKIGLTYAGVRVFDVNRLVGLV